MNLRQLIDQFRADTRDQQSKYMWTDDEIIGYANEAVDEACRRALLLVDSSSTASEASLGIGESEIDLHDSVIYVRRVRISGAHALQPCVSREMDERVPGWEDSQASTPMLFIPDWETNKIKVWPPASAAVEIKMTVIRTPLNEMSEDEDEPEISGRYHRALLDWMKFLGYSKQDADTMDAAKALKFEERFAGEFGLPQTAKDEQWGREQYYDVGAY
jgi:hypothetical protein